MENKNNTHYLLIFIFCFFICFADGSEMVILSLQMRQFTVIWEINSFQKAFLGSSVFLGFIFGASIVGLIMSRKGRKFSFGLGCLIFLTFSLFSCFSSSYYFFLCCRIFLGVGIGIIIPTNQTYITELMPKNLRGIYSILIWTGFACGELYICLIGYLLPLDNQIKEHKSNWKILSFFAGFPVNS